MLQQIGLVAAGGALGAAMRYLIGEWLNGDGFPYATLTVNLIGSFVLGMLTVGIAQQFVSEQMVLVFATGFLGAFTTMSAFSQQTIELLYNGKELNALIYVVAVSYTHLTLPTILLV